MGCIYMQSSRTSLCFDCFPRFTPSPQKWIKMVGFWRVEFSCKEIQLGYYTMVDSRHQHKHVWWSRHFLKGFPKVGWSVTRWIVVGFEHKGTLKWQTLLEIWKKHIKNNWSVEIQITFTMRKPTEQTYQKENDSRPKFHAWKSSCKNRPADRTW